MLTTMVPIMVVLCTDPRPTLTCKLVYAIWVFLPALLIARCAPGDMPLFDAPKRTLWKIALRPDVEKWEASAKLIGSTLDLGDDFLHTSDARMVRKVAAMFFKGHANPQPRVQIRVPLACGNKTVQQWTQTEIEKEKVRENVRRV